MTRCKLFTAATIVCLLFLSTGLSAEDRSSSKIAIGDDAGLRSLTISGRKISPSLNGAGFEAYDVTAGKRIAFSEGKVKDAPGGIAYECQARGIVLQAEFTARNGFVMVTGTLENTHQDERGFILGYRIPAISPDALFSNELGHAVAMADSEEYEGNTFPIGAMCNGDTGIALAIPPSEPRIFGMAGGEQGMTVRFYLGLSPETGSFPNCASFVFAVYPVEPAWGFRSALSKYYGFFPDYYTPRLKRDGLFMFQMEDRLPPNVGQYGFSLVETQSPTLDAAIARDEKHGVATFPYMIVGQREIKFLDALPQDYDEAMAAYAKWSLADHAGHALTKENAASQGDIHLKEEVEASACKMPDGKYAIFIRNTPWGDDSVTFKINPNPDLFKDENRPTVASYALDLTDRWLKQHPEYDGMFVDSLGRNWPAVLNYRRDHFKYARYPLTVDPQGRIALHNQISHYEYVETLRAKMRATDRLVLANGVYAYKSKIVPTKPAQGRAVDSTLNEYVQQSTPAEHYRPGAKLGRFFCASLLDVASSEAGVKATTERCQDVRTFMGQKQYAFLSYHWEDVGKVEEFVNRSLCYAIFASNSTNFFTGVQYEDHPDGYLRDKALLDWYVPLVRKLSRAGWEPVTYAAISGKKVLLERFGSGDRVYFTVFSEHTAAQDCTLTVDLDALGFAPEGYGFSEIGRQTPLVVREGRQVTLSVAPLKCCIVALTRKP